ncbi:MAG: BolA family transcriptional regulator [Candidatus Marinimicrobia bacterium]|nr:BolA family transcriptional regulator [Candidatus Neomarinimicrobiota bacterium]|tara:strand:+ start:98090 stop:98359 length:270 start_codon:yes stop_codon:yes gene_type:complete
MIKEKIKNLIENKLDIVHMEIKDTTSQHINHANHKGGSHLRMKIVSNDFIDKSLVQRHQMIYSIINDFIQKEIHAVILKTFTVDEFENL